MSIVTWCVGSTSHQAPSSVWQHDRPRRGTGWMCQVQVAMKRKTWTVVAMLSQPSLWHPSTHSPLTTLSSLHPTHTPQRSPNRWVRHTSWCKCVCVLMFIYEWQLTGRYKRNVLMNLVMIYSRCMLDCLCVYVHMLVCKHVMSHHIRKVEQIRHWR